MAAILAGREDFASTLVELGFADKSFKDALRTGSYGSSYDEYSENARIIKAALCAGTTLQSAPPTYLRDTRETLVPVVDYSVPCIVNLRPSPCTDCQEMLTIQKGIEMTVQALAAPL